LHASFRSGNETTAAATQWGFVEPTADNKSRAPSIPGALFNCRLERVLHGEPGDPRLPPEQVNEVLIANTFHELTDPQAILTHVRQALVPGGGLVVLDRSPKLSTDGASPLAEHQISAELVDSELRQTGFEILRRRDDFIERDRENEGWWLIAARKP
jgi:hypothetical protein